MTFATTLFEQPPKDFPAEQQEELPLGTRLAVPTVLLLACFALRAIVSLKWDIIWGDTIVYLNACDALKQGDFDRAFASLGLNTYPAILLVMRWLGLDCIVAAVWWSVLMSSLTTLPLLGWVRRQFDYRLAVLACIFYAVQPKLLGVSPLTIRDPTFWFLFTLTLYLLWRAVTETRLSFFIVGGLTLTLACFTRTEGWLLLVPLALWPLGKLPAAHGNQRLKLIGGAMLSVAMIPLLLLVVNLTLLKNHSRWEFGNNNCMEHLLKTVGVSNDQAGNQAATVEPKATQTGSVGKTEALPPKTATTARQEKQPRTSAIATTLTIVRKVLGRLIKAFAYVYGALAMIGLWRWRRLLLRREHLAILAMNVLLLLAIGIRYLLDSIDIRYYLPIVIVATPFMGLGLLQAVRWFLPLAVRLRVPPRWRTTVTGTVLLGMTALSGVFNVMPVAREAMYEHAELGMWILDRLGPERKIAGSYDKQGLIAYYAQGRIIRCPGHRPYTAESLMPIIRDRAADVILLWRDQLHNRDWQPYMKSIIERQDEIGYHEVAAENVPPSCANVRVLVRDDIRLE